MKYLKRTHKMKLQMTTAIYMGLVMQDWLPVPKEPFVRDPKAITTISNIVEGVMEMYPGRKKIRMRKDFLEDIACHVANSFHADKMFLRKDNPDRWEHNSDTCAACCVLDTLNGFRGR